MSQSSNKESNVPKEVNKPSGFSTPINSDECAGDFFDPLLPQYPVIGGSDFDPTEIRPSPVDNPPQIQQNINAPTEERQLFDNVNFIDPSGSHSDDAYTQVIMQNQLDQIPSSNVIESITHVASFADHYAQGMMQYQMASNQSQNIKAIHMPNPYQPHFGAFEPYPKDNNPGPINTINMQPNSYVSPFDEYFAQGMMQNQMINNQNINFTQQKPYLPTFEDYLAHELRQQQMMNQRLNNNFIEMQPNPNVPSFENYFAQRWHYRMVNNQNINYIDMQPQPYLPSLASPYAVGMMPHQMYGGTYFDRFGLHPYHLPMAMAPHAIVPWRPVSPYPIRPIFHLLQRRYRFPYRDPWPQVPNRFPLNTGSNNMPNVFNTGTGGNGGIPSLSPSSRESVDPIAELLSQLSGVRRSAGNSNSSTPTQLQQLQMQLQLERQQMSAVRQQLERFPRKVIQNQGTLREPTPSSSSGAGNLMLNPSPVAQQPIAASSTGGNQFLLSGALEEANLSSKMTEQSRQPKSQFVQELMLSVMTSSDDDKIEENPTLALDPRIKNLNEEAAEMPNVTISNKPLADSQDDGDEDCSSSSDQKNDNPDEGSS